MCIVAFACNNAIAPSNTPFTNTTILNEDKEVILVGHHPLAVFTKEPYSVWFEKAYNAYTPDSSIIVRAKPLTDNVTIEVFLGSWCGDSKREVPRMLKVLHEMSFDTTHVQLIFVDNSTATYKQSPQHEEKNKNIFRVPTFIIYQGRKETGRIIETPVQSLEKDLLTILQHKPYTPKYHAVSYWQHHAVKQKQTMTDEQLQMLAAAIKPLCSSMSTFNSYGYVLLARQHIEEALNVFRLNTFLYPDKSGVFDSLGEACMIAGNKQQAKLMYQKALQLEPGNEHIIEVLKKLQ